MFLSIKLISIRSYRSFSFLHSRQDHSLLSIISKISQRSSSFFNIRKQFISSSSKHFEKDIKQVVKFSTSSDNQEINSIEVQEQEQEEEETEEGQKQKIDWQSLGGMVIGVVMILVAGGVAFAESVDINYNNEIFVVLNSNQIESIVCKFQSFV